MRGTAYALRKRTTLLAVLTLVIAVALTTLLWLWEADHSDFSSDSEFEMAELLAYGGEYYHLRRNVETVLVMGVDRFSGEVERIADSYNNDRCADFLALLVIDHEKKSCSLLQINRDTIADVTILGVGGRHVGRIQQQIALSHTYGTGEDDSCRNTMRSVSALLGNLTVNHYVCLTMDAVGIVNDMVGGVALTIPEDLTAIDPSFTEGAQIVLQAEQALAYVRQRSVLEDSSNEARMRRQEQYLEALFERVLELMGESDSFAIEALSGLSEHMRSNYDIGTLERTAERLTSYEHGGFYSLKGTYTVGEHMEFYPDEDELTRLLIELFYEKEI